MIITRYKVVSFLSGLHLIRHVNTVDRKALLCMIMMFEVTYS